MIILYKNYLIPRDVLKLNVFYKMTYYSSSEALIFFLNGKKKDGIY